MSFFRTHDAATAPPDPTAARRRMVDRHLRDRGIRDERVLCVMGRIARERFVPPAERDHAYDDGPLAIGYDATISQPFIVALMTEALELQGGERVLEIGTGSGYQTAILAELAREVFTVEIVPELADLAQGRLHAAGYGNVRFRTGDGRGGWPEQAPFNAILLTAAPDLLPPALADQLAPAGKLVAPVGRDDQVLEVWHRRAGGLDRRALTHVRFVPLLGEG